MESLFQSSSTSEGHSVLRDSTLANVISRKPSCTTRFLHLIYLISFFFMLRTNAYSQTIYYNYDNSGNRLSKFYLPIYTRGGISEYDDTEEEVPDFNSNIIVSVGDNDIRVFIIDFEETMTCNIFLYTPDGKLVMNRHMDAPIATLKTDGLSNGVYILCVTINNKKQTWKFTKE